MIEKSIFISWAPYSRRSQSLCANLNINWYSIHHLKFQRPVYAPAKYILQAIHTLALLLKKRPRLVFVQDPPIFASLFVYIYTVLTFGWANFVIDAHTGALVHPWWKRFRILQKFLYRRALTVITTNHTLAGVVRSWNANSIVLTDPPAKIPTGEAMKLGPGFNVMLVNTFSIDEPLPAVLEAVEDLPNVHLYVTGDVNKANPSLLETAPKNVTFTGFLSDDDYLMLMRGVHAVMVLTDENFTLQSGAIEAIAVGKPLIMSDLSFLREYFNQGAVYASNTPIGIRQGLIKLQNNLDCLTKEILALRQAHQKEWIAKSQQLRKLVDRNNKMKLLVVLGEGGHTTELLNLVDLLGDHYDYCYIVSKSDNLLDRIRRLGPIYRVTRPRTKDTKFLSAIFRTLLATIESLWILLRLQPTAMVSTGPAIFIPASIVGKFLGVRIIFVETGSRIRSLSLTGRIMYRWADLFFVQWPQLKEVLPRAIYAGRLV